MRSLSTLASSLRRFNPSQNDPDINVVEIVGLGWGNEVRELASFERMYMFELSSNLWL